MGLRRVALAQGIATCSGACFWILLALSLHPYALGEVGWVYCLSMLCSTLASLGLGKSIVVCHSPSPSTAFYTLLLSSTFVGLPLSFLLHPWAGPLLFSFCLFSLSFHLCLAEADYSHYLLLWVLRSCMLSLPLLLYLLVGEVWVIYLGLVLSHLCPGLSALRRLSVTMVTDKPHPGRLAGFLLTDLGAASLSFLDKVVAGPLLGMTTLGLYYFSCRLFYLLAFLPQTLFFYGLSTGSRRLRRLALRSSLGLLAACLPLSLLLPNAFPDYSACLPAFQLMLLAIVPATLSQVCSAELLSERRPAGTSVAYATAVPLQLLSVLVLGRRFGLMGLAGAFLLTQCVLACMLWLMPRLREESRRICLGLLSLALLCPLLLLSLSMPRYEYGPGYVSAEDLVMDTLVRITVLDENLQLARSAVSKALEEVHRLDRMLSSEEGGTEIWEVNHSAGWVRVSPETYQLLQASLHYARLTGGAFDPTVKPLVDLWMKEVRRTGKLPSRERLEEVRGLVDWRRVRLENGRVRLEQGMELTLGGIAKGYAADRACEILRSAGIRAGMVQIGGEIRVFGKTWEIGIQHPRRPEKLLGRVKLRDAAISTSGDYIRVYFLGSRRLHHIIDPRTGEPATGCQSVTVIAPTGMEADALSTAAFVLGPQAGLELLENLGLQGVIVDSEGKIYWTENLSWSPES